MSKNKDYIRMLNSARWKQLRLAKLAMNPICEMCEKEGKVTAAIDVHHIREVESGHTLKEMEELCFNIHNTMALCIACHIKVHQDRKSHTKEAHQQRENDRLQRWIERHDKKINQ